MSLPHFLLVLCLCDISR